MSRGRGLVEQQRAKAAFERDHWMERAKDAENRVVYWMDRATRAEAERDATLAKLAEIEPEYDEMHSVLDRTARALLGTVGALSGEQIPARVEALIARTTQERDRLVAALARRVNECAVCRGAGVALAPGWCLTCSPDAHLLDEVARGWRER